MKYSVDIKTTEIGENGFAKNRGWIKTFICMKDAPHEYIGATMEFLHDGLSVGECSYTDAPEIPNNDEIAIIRSLDGKQWLYVPDHRGKTVYDTNNRASYPVDYLGVIKTGFTLLAPVTKFDKWDGKKWVTDNQAMKADQINTANQTKLHLIDEAETKITLLERKVRLGMATNSEKTALRAWEMYSVKLNDIDTATAPEIDWPKKPE
ncbi:tail fiber assembly protein [Arsenophonus endosymbiont of Crataerina pallida]|uniref:tail fiber assembly protein n=1 Tax=Arsenophonus endosymbiont of Crataerina pallida TaxID=3066235 RepID=UPI0030D44FE7